MKTYNERLNLIAEEMAKDYRQNMWDRFTQTQKDALIVGYLPQARIALKHSAEEWKLGYLYANSDDLTERAGGFKIAINEHLTSLGLIEPQTT